MKSNSNHLKLRIEEGSENYSSKDDGQAHATINASSINLKTPNTQSVPKAPEIDFEEFQNEIHVDPDLSHDCYHSIQSAIDSAQPKTKIVIHSGIYREHLVIQKKSDIELTCSNPEMPPILIATNGPCLLIENIVQGCTVKIAGIRFLHRGMRGEYNTDNPNITIDDMNNTNDNIDKSYVTYDSVQTKRNCIYNNSHQIDQMEVNFNIDINVMDGIIIENRGYISGITIKNATVMFINSQITLGFLTTETTMIITGIYCERATVFMESVLVKGNPEFLTTGIFGYETSIKITNSRFVNHRSGGALCSIGPRNQVIISKSQFLNNHGCGLFIVNISKDKDESLLISEDVQNEQKNIENIPIENLENNSKKNDVALESNLFDENIGTGLKLQNCKNLLLIRNKSFGNQASGTELIDCNGLCLLNEFVKNNDNGLVVESILKNVQLKVRKNVTCENNNHGIYIKGKNNNTKISNNEKITNNKKSGICIINEAHPEIKNNSISTNLFQGILICCDSSAHIEENKVFGNLKAGIAFGGEKAKDVEIINNEIYRGRSEGIFCIDGNGGLIARNRIFDNNDGILLFNAQDIEVSENDIFQNIRCGIMISNKSTPQMFQNQVRKNLFIGMHIIEESRGVYENNIIKDNPTQVYYSNSCKNLIDIHFEKNTIEGRYDEETRCVIF